MKRICLLLLALGLVVPAASLAEGPPGPPLHGGPPPGSGPPGPPTTQALAAALCIAEFRTLGEAAFKAKYPTREACMQAHADQAAEILATCKSAADPKACIRDAVGAPEPSGDTSEGKPGAKPGQGPRRAPPTALVPKVAAALCRAEYKSLGADAFKQKYTTPQACMRQMASKATAIVKAAVAQCANAEKKPACVQAAIAKALGLPAATPKK